MPMISSVVCGTCATAAVAGIRYVERTSLKEAYWDLGGALRALSFCHRPKWEIPAADRHGYATAGIRDVPQLLGKRVGRAKVCARIATAILRASGGRHQAQRGKAPEAVALTSIKHLAREGRRGAGHFIDMLPRAYAGKNVAPLSDMAKLIVVACPAGAAGASRFHGPFGTGRPLFMVREADTDRRMRGSSEHGDSNQTCRE